MDILGILDPDPDPHENLCGFETLPFNNENKQKTVEKFLYQHLACVKLM